MANMRQSVACFLIVLLSVTSWLRGTASDEICRKNSEEQQQPTPPYVTAPSSLYLPDEDAFVLQDVKSYWYPSGSTTTGTCVADDDDDNDRVVPPLESINIGQVPQFETYQAKAVLDEAVKAWDGGMGTWPQMSLGQRIAAVEAFFDDLAARREEIVHVLMWEIGKNFKDAESEFDRTVQFAQHVIQAIRTDPEFVGQWQTVGSTTALVRRAAIGVVMSLGPYNYPLNETYATLIPALLLGNIILLKIPTVGGLVHLLTMESFAKTLPRGAINFIAGSGRKTMPPLMETGLIDGLAFIGGSKAADDLILHHPHPHRLKVFLQLEANNMGIYLSDAFDDSNEKLLDNAVDETLLGSLSFNGQRCTALKLLFCPRQHAELFVDKIVQRVSSLSIGLPWQTSQDGRYSEITPLPTPKRVQYMQSLIQDAVQKGAKIINQDGGTLLGGSKSTLMIPAILYPVTSDMKVYSEEQFGPIVPIAVYDDLATVLKFAQDGEFGQQVSIFGGNVDETSLLVDRFSSIFGKINLNSQCGRSPDTLPFSGRRSSAMGTMSVTEATREFSVHTVIAYKQKNHLSDELAAGISSKSKFLEVYT